MSQTRPKTGLALKIASLLEKKGYPASIRKHYEGKLIPIQKETERVLEMWADTSKNILVYPIDEVNTKK